MRDVRGPLRTVEEYQTATDHLGDTVTVKRYATIGDLIARTRTIETTYTPGEGEAVEIQVTYAPHVLTPRFIMGLEKAAAAGEDDIEKVFVAQASAMTTLVRKCSLFGTGDTTVDDWLGTDMALQEFITNACTKDSTAGPKATPSE